MAKSTGIVVTAGALGMVDLVLNDWNPKEGLRLLVGTTAAAFVSAGLDKMIDGFGTGLAILLLLSALMRNMPHIVKKLFPG
jgi:hypothetical protein